MNNRREFILSPSILSADFSKLGDQIEELNKNNIKYIHIDVMDGMFVPSISFGMPVITSIRSKTKAVFDVHLMIEEPSRYIEEFKKAGADLITVHVEACKHLNRTLAMIRQAGIKVGVALNPSTPICELEYVLDMVDMVLLMSVNPGFGGQSYISNVTDKIKALKQMIDSKGYDIDIQVDGGVNKDNVKEIYEAGANVIVAGTAVFKGDISENIKNITV